MGATIGIRFGATAVTLAVTSCFAVVDVERFHSQPNPRPDGSAVRSAPGEYLNLRLSLVGMTPHVMQLFEYRVIDANMFIQSRGMVNPLGAANVTINVPFAVPKVSGPYHFDFYADVNGSGGYDGIGSILTRDHAWRIDPLEDSPADSVMHVDGLIQATFTHNTSFTPIEQYPSGTPNPAHDIGADAVIHVTNAPDLVSALIQVRIVDTVLNHTVGLFRVPQITVPDFTMTIPGIVENGTEYAALVYVDSNLNGKYDNPATPPGDLGWRVVGTAGMTGLDVLVDAQTIQQANIDVGAP